MKPRLLLASLSALAFATSSFAISPALELGIAGEVEFDYSSSETDYYQSGQYQNMDTFLSDNPVFELTPQNTSGYGIGDFGYLIYNFVDNGFSATAVYDWTIDLYYSYEFFAVGDFGTIADGDSGFASFGFTASLADVTNLLFGMTPEDLAALFLSLPPEGDLSGLLSSLSLSWPFESNVPANSIFYTTDFGIPFGSGQFLLTEAIDGVDYATGYVSVELDITATERHASVPDSGSTSALVLLGIGSIITLRRRFMK